MPTFDIKNIETFSKNSFDPYFEELESQKKHTPYEVETAFYDCIEKGDIDGTEKMMNTLFSQNIVIGRMSNNDLRQMQYFAVCCVTLGTRAAIRGGLSEIIAFNLSDEYIRKIDLMTNSREIALFISQKAIELTALVKESSHKKIYHYRVKKAVHYIESHLYEKITPAATADYCEISKDYLNKLFKENTGKTLGRYIIEEKLKEGKRLVKKGLTVSQIAYQLSFCSESYFIAKYKELYGETPGKSS